MYRLTIRATDESVPPVLIKIMEERLGHGEETEQANSSFLRSGRDDFDVVGVGS
jgi:hypothetical protein